jgi:2,4-dienoyl-CoA reductase-like NADH-dependent reductase (Old Yellow Enzyme family)/thioredoxin reductase
LIKFAKLLEPTRIGSIELRNRIVMPPMNMQLADVAGSVTERKIAFYEERAKGGAGLIEIGALCIDDEIGRTAHPQLSIDGYKYTPALSDLVDHVHRYGAKICPQLHHVGYNLPYLEATGGRPPVAPSEIDCPYLPGIKAKELSVGEIHAIVEKYARAAALAHLAGFDAVGIQAAHGFSLVCHFLSPTLNKRTDEYGGDLKRRARFAVEIVREIKAKLGRAFPIIFRLSGDEYTKGGTTLEDTKNIAKMLEEAGLDALHISAGNSSSPDAFWATIPPMDVPHGCHVHLAESIKQVVSIPVITVGRINDPEFAESILQEAKADLVAMGRALIVDPELPRKVAEGRLRDIRKCIGCLQDCDADFGLRVKCAINADLGKEREYAITPAKNKKNVLVIGGGPAGMEAARVSSLRGHKVTLVEKSRRLGGQLLLSEALPHKKDVRNLIDFLAYQLKKLRVKVELGKEATAKLVERMNPDAVVVATGATPLLPSIPGVRRRGAVTAWDTLRSHGRNIVGENVIVAGGGGVGCEAAELLAMLGKRVTIVEMLRDIATELPSKRRYFLKQRLGERGVRIMTGLEIEEVTNKGAVALDRESGEQLDLEGTVVLALGATPNNELVRRLRGRVRELHAIGDCVRPRRILEAIHEGSFVSRQI